MSSSQKVDVVVVGASVAGLLSAAAAASAGTEVVVIDRRSRPGQGSSIAPQGRFPHVLLAGGVVALESLLAGIVAELLDEGAQPARSTSGLWWAGGVRPAWKSPHVIPLARRAQIEEVIRRRVEALPGVSIRYETRAAGLVGMNTHVQGVEVDDGRLLADLVVDAAGRGSHLDQWLERLGRARLRTEEQRIDVSYAAVFVEDTIGCLGSSNWVVVQNQPPRWPRIGLTIRVDPITWSVVLAGYHGDDPPADLDGLRAFARTLPIDHVATVLDHADDSTEILRHRIPTSRRRRLSSRGLPSGLVVAGDSLCSFNPVFGQGMTVAAQQALALRQHLAAPGWRSASTARLQRRIERPANEAWTAATTLDADHPDSSGVRPNPVQRRYMHAVIGAATRNATVARDLDRVASLTAPGSSLLRPGTVARVLSGRRSMPDPATEPSVGRQQKECVAR